MFNFSFLPRSSWLANTLLGEFLCVWGAKINKNLLKMVEFLSFFPSVGEASGGRASDGEYLPMPFMLLPVVTIGQVDPPFFAAWLVAPTAAFPTFSFAELH